MTQASATNPQHDPVMRRRARLWIGIIVGLLCAHTFGMLLVMFIATGDPSQAVVPDYHDKAVNFDQLQARRRASEALGWGCQIDASLEPDMLGQRTVRISLRDADGEPLTDATVTFDAYHHARANDVVHAELKESVAGQYTVLIPMRRDGTWTFTVDAKHGDDHYVMDITQQVGPYILTVPSGGAGK